MVTMMTTAMTTAEAWTRYLDNGDTVSRDQLILHHTPLVKYVIGRLVVRPPRGLDYEDLLSAGIVGLIQAFERYDPSRGVAFQSYAVPRIRGAIIDALRAVRGVSQWTGLKAKRLQRTQSELDATLGRAPTDTELAAALGISTQQLGQQMIDARWVTVSLDTINDSQDTGGDAEVGALTSRRGEDDVQGMVERREAVAELSDAWHTLSEREQAVLRLYYQQELPMRVIGQMLAVSESRVCQLHARALHKLRGAMGPHAPERSAA